MARLTAGLWVDAYRHRLGLMGISCYIASRGDPTAGAVLIKLALMNGEAKAFVRSVTPEGREWTVLKQGPEAEVDASIAKQRGFDPDLWVVEVEDARGRHLLDEPGLD